VCCMVTGGGPAIATPPRPHARALSALHRVLCSSFRLGFLCFGVSIPCPCLWYNSRRCIDFVTFHFLVVHTDMTAGMGRTLCVMWQHPPPHRSMHCEEPGLGCAMGGWVGRGGGAPSCARNCLLHKGFPVPSHLHLHLSTIHRRIPPPPPSSSTIHPPATPLGHHRPTLDTSKSHWPVSSSATVGIPTKGRMLRTSASGLRISG
jgi:hypothetical protein